MTCDYSDEEVEIELGEGKIMSRINDRLEFSKYLICPTRKSYRVFHDSLTVVFMTLHKWLTGRRTGQGLSLGRRQASERLLPTENRTAAGFDLGRRDSFGPVQQKWVQQRIKSLESDISDIVSNVVQPAAVAGRWKAHVRSRWNDGGNLWMKGVCGGRQMILDEEKVVKYLEALKADLTQNNSDEWQGHEMNFKLAAADKIAGTRYMISDSANIRWWMNYPGVMKLIRTAKEVLMVDEISATPRSEMETELLKSKKYGFDSLLRAGSAIAASQAGPIVSSLVVSVVKQLQSHPVAGVWVAEEMTSVDGLYMSMISKVKYLVTNDLDWPERKR